ncbi:polysaccharide deacetylase family protein [Candidatus Omnitrophota bacterium]
MSGDRMIPVLIYHEVNEKETNSGAKRRMHPACCLSVEQFNEQMHYLHNHNFRSFLPEEILEYSSSQKVAHFDKKPIVITFDDGHIGNYKYALPTLKKYGFKAVFFIATDLIGRENMLTWSQLKEMVNEGMRVESHTVSHYPLSSISDEQIENELLESKRIIEERLGVKVKYLSLPHGDFDSRLEAAARKAGYKGVFSSQARYCRSNNQSFFSGRIEIRQDYNLDDFISIVEKRGSRLKMPGAGNKFKFYLRSLIGVNNYRKIYRFINRIKPRDSQS